MQQTLMECFKGFEDGGVYFYKHRKNLFGRIDRSNFYDNLIIINLKHTLVLNGSLWIWHENIPIPLLSECKMLFQNNDIISLECRGVVYHFYTKNFIENHTQIVISQ